MIAILQTLSWSYIRRHWGRTSLILSGVAIAVGTVVAVRSAQETLASGVRSTVMQLAGGADLQITALAGVPEALLETLRDEPVIASDQPVIEQIVVPETANGGALLILGVDLVGDTQVRPYGFDGEDADIDDPLVFLAQPDSIAVGATFAQRAGLRKGDALQVRIGAASKRLVVRALLAPKGFVAAYGGNVGIMDVYAAQALFGRGRRFDRIDIRLRPGAEPTRASSAIEQRIGSGYRLVTPEQRGAELERTAATFVSAFDLMTIVAGGFGLFMIFNVFAIGVERRRRDISVLRSIGATPRQVMTIFLAEAAILGAMGGAIGVAAGAVATDVVSRAMDALLAEAEGMSEPTHPRLTLLLVAAGIGFGMLSGVVGAWGPARHAAKVKPVDVTSTGGTIVAPERLNRHRGIVGAALLAVALVIGNLRVGSARVIVTGTCLIGALGAIAIAGEFALGCLRLLSPILSWMAPASGRIATDMLRGHPRRTAATAAVIAVGASFVLGTAGYLSAVRVAFDRWFGNSAIADVVVRQSLSTGPTSVRLPAEAEATLRALPGVVSVDGVRTEQVRFRNQPVTLMAIDPGGFAARSRAEFVAGDERAYQGDFRSGRACIVSETFARRFDIQVGDVVAIDAPSSAVRLPVAAIVVSLRGAILVDRAFFETRWSDGRIDALNVALAPGADAQRMRTQIQAGALGFPVLALTGQEVASIWKRSLARLDGAIRSVVVIAFLVGFMGVLSSILASVVERSRDIGVLRAIGAAPRQLWLAVLIEASALTAVALLLAAPLGELLAWMLRLRVTADAIGFTFSRVYPVDTLTWLVLGLPIVAVSAMWVPIRRTLGLSVTHAISYE